MLAVPGHLYRISMSGKNIGAEGGASMVGPVLAKYPVEVAQASSSGADDAEVVVRPTAPAQIAIGDAIRSLIHAQYSIAEDAIVRDVVEVQGRLQDGLSRESWSQLAASAGLLAIAAFLAHRIRRRMRT